MVYQKKRAANEAALKKGDRETAQKYDTINYGPYHLDDL